MFRRVDAGPQPRHRGAPGPRRWPAAPSTCARLLGHGSAERPGEYARPGHAAGVLPDATDGWELAKTSVRDLYAEADLHADEVGGDFAGEAQRLGAATAEVHADLARALPTGMLDARRAGRAGRRHAAPAGRRAAGVPELADVRGRRCAPRSTALAAHGDPVPVQRVHGDFHLGQVLRTSHGWMLLDFEGEPARRWPSARGLDSPVRDVAGMLRSFDYAARHLLADHPYDPQLRLPRRRVGRAQPGRRSATGTPRPAAPTRASDAVLLRAYETDKAVYEVVYEARNRPAWLPIPLAALARLAEGARS